MLPSMTAVLLSICAVSTSAVLPVSHATGGSEAIPDHAELANDQAALRDALLWEGLDFENPFMFTNLRQSEEKAMASVEASVQVFGLQDTGTNLLSAMLITNFERRLRFFDYSRPVNASGIFRHGLWKHANFQMKFAAEPEEVKELTAQNVTALIMLRDPLSWLQSIRKAPYELTQCVIGSQFKGSNWLDRTCQHPVPAGYNSTAGKANFANLEQIWNDWTRVYLHATHFSFKNFLIIRYEDLVQDPAGQMNRIASTLGVRQTRPWQVVQTSAKDHGSSSGRMAALLKLSSKTYLGEYFPTQTTTACSHLDPALLLANNYTYCTSILEAAGVSSTFVHTKQTPVHKPAAVANKTRARSERPRTS